MLTFVYQRSKLCASMCEIVNCQMSRFDDKPMQHYADKTLKTAHYPN